MNYDQHVRIGNSKLICATLQEKKMRNREIFKSLKGKAWKMGINKDKIINEGIQVWNVKSLQPGKESIEKITEKTKNDRETKNKQSKIDRYQKSDKSSETRY